jgi:hypothetical protein
MRALDPEVVDAVWKTIKPTLPRRPDRHPLGCHRPRVPDRLCFWGILIRLVVGSTVSGWLPSTVLEAVRLGSGCAAWSAVR